MGGIERVRVLEDIVRHARKLRLYACACCRRVWHLLKDERSRRAVDVAERYADGKATEEERKSLLPFAWLSPNVSTRVKFSSRRPFESMNGLSTRK